MNKFSVFFKSGGGDRVAIVSTYWQKITKLFNIISQDVYSTDIDKFHIELRVDGDFFQFGDPEGCNTLRLFKKRRLIANSVSFGADIYTDESILSEFLIENLLLTFEQIIDRLNKENLNIEGVRLLQDLNKHIAMYW